MTVFNTCIAYSKLQTTFYRIKQWHLAAPPGIIVNDAGFEPGGGGPLPRCLYATTSHKEY